MTTDTYNRKSNHDFKPVTRGYVVRQMTGRVARRVLFLPSTGMGDIKRALAAKVVSPHFTSFFFIESDRNNAEVIERKARELGLQHVKVFNTKFQNFDFSSYHAEKPFDAVYLDSCGELSPEVFAWLYRHRQALNEVKTLAFTFSALPRLNKLHKFNFDNSIPYHNEFTVAPGGNSAIIGFDPETPSNQNCFWSVAMAMIALGRYRLVRLGRSGNRMKVQDLFCYKEQGQSLPMVYFALTPYRGIECAETDALAERCRQKDFSKPRFIVRSTLTVTPAHKPKRKHTVPPPRKGGDRFIDRFYGWTPGKIRAWSIDNRDSLNPSEKAKLTAFLKTL